MRASWAVAGSVAAAGVALGGLGLVIARRLTAPVSKRVYELTIRGVDDSGERTIVVLDRTPRTAAPGLYCLLLENGGVIRLSSTVEDRGPSLVGRMEVGEPHSVMTPGRTSILERHLFSVPRGCRA